MRSGGRRLRDFSKLFVEAVEAGLAVDKSDVTPHLVYCNLSPRSTMQYEKMLDPWRA
jgi:hypothetical protein